MLERPSDGIYPWNVAVCSSPLPNWMMPSSAAPIRERPDAEMSGKTSGSTSPQERSSTAPRRYHSTSTLCERKKGPFESGFDNVNREPELVVISSPSSASRRRRLSQSARIQQGRPDQCDHAAASGASSGTAFVYAGRLAQPDTNFGKAIPTSNCFSSGPLL